MKLGVELKI